MATLSQRTRLIILGLYVIMLLCASKFALGSWLPPTTEKGLWFYSGLATLLLGNLLVTPFYTKPADTIAYAVAALVALLAVNLWSQTQYTGFDRFLWSVASVYVSLVFLAGIVSIALRDLQDTLSQKISRSLYVFGDILGTPRVVFSAVFLFALIAFHRYQPREYIVISFSWIMFVGLRPLESVAALILRWFGVWRPPLSAKACGELIGHEMPGIVLLRCQQGSEISFGELLIAPRDDGQAGVAVALDQVGFAEGRWLRALHICDFAALQNCLASDSALVAPGEIRAFRVDSGGLELPATICNTWEQKDRLVGLVASDTDISRLRIELVRADLDIEEGRLVEVQIRSKPVLYQVINGFTREEILQQKNTRGYVRADAKKIGHWNDQLGRFEVIKWIPNPNTPVFLVDPSPAVPEKEAVGHFPGTSYTVSIDPDSLVTHNTAVLGILGAGKTFLALELIERMIQNGIKVICFDLTNQYAEHLSPYYRQQQERRRVSVLENAGPPGKENYQRNVEEGGSIGNFKDLVHGVLREFLDPEKTDYLAIYNPTEFEIWRQDSKPFQDRASMASLTPTEVTRIFTEAALEVLQEQGMTDKARCCLVFEEAHSLIPEWSAVATEGDKAATNGTAKAVLQGRKYGLGCLVITQRTANVTKSILNQCNTVFALRVFDATGMEFLKNYIGEDYAGVLSMLEDRHAVLFGRGSSCRAPVLLELNERTEFLQVFRSGSEQS